MTRVFKDGFPEGFRSMASSQSNDAENGYKKLGGIGLGTFVRESDWITSEPIYNDRQAEVRI